MKSMRQAAPDPVLAGKTAPRHLAQVTEDCRARWRLALDSAWERKIDEIIALSKASFGLTSDDDGNPAQGGLPVSSRLHARTERAYQELAAIEEDIARIEDGTYGPGRGCD
jgi:hypothetical protein